MPTIYVQATIRVTSPQPITDDDAINAAVFAFDSLSRELIPEGTDYSEQTVCVATVIVHEDVDADEMAEMESDIEGDKQQP